MFVLTNAAPSVAQTRPNVDGPSFDCRYAKLPVEQAVCRTRDLARFDGLVAERFERLLQVRPDEEGHLRETQEQWVVSRDECGRQRGRRLIECLREVYRARVLELRDELAVARQPNKSQRRKDEGPDSQEAPPSAAPPSPEAAPPPPSNSPEGPAPSNPAGPTD